VAQVLSANYELESEVGRGGMGIVYCAKDRRLKREIAVKVLPPELSFRADIRQRFLREAETAAQLNHPNIVPIYTVEERENLVYFVMAYIKGDNLGQRLQQHGPMPPVEVRRILREVGDALAYAHHRNVIHRDIKPDNIMLADGVEASVRSLSSRDEPAIRRALAAANAERFVTALPNRLGEELRERGVNLSQGQRQLLAIARAIIYNPRVLALDEATSSIDPESEALVRVGLARLLEGRTSVVIAHRLSTIQRADRILVLHRGRIREAGGHAELLAQGGLYSRLHELQFGLGRA